MSENPQGGVVDVWANWWPETFFRDEPHLDALYQRLQLTDRTRLTKADVVAEATAGGVTKIVLSATATSGAGVDNDSVAALAIRHPDLIVGCASVDPHAGMAAVHELRRAVGDLHMQALKLLPFFYGAPPNAAIYYPLYAACIDLDIPVLILTGHTAVALPNDVGRPGHLDEVALHFPELKIIAGHAGFPWTQELISLSWKHQNLYIDTSGHRPKYFPPELTRYLNSYGSQKVLFGTGYPMMDFAGPLGEVADLGLKPAAEAAFLGGNARRIWGWP